MSILIAEDEPDLLDLLAYALRRAGHEVYLAHDGPTALQLWKAKDPSLILLDIDIPEINGWDVCRSIRSESAVPVIMLTAANDDRDIVRGLETGADDYITKPFSPRQLLARIGAVLRRSSGGPGGAIMGPQILTAGDIGLNPQWRTVARNGDSIRLTRLEFALLYELVLHEGRVLTHRQLTERVWGYQNVDDAGIIKGHIRNIRRKLEPDPTRSTYVHTVVGIGYIFRRALPDDSCNPA